ncbi:MAG: hypothetical protein AAF561_07805, partial [Planctomycetota bacterium]
AGKGYHALLMMNMDGFDKTVNVRLPLDGGTWSVELPVEGAEGAASALPAEISTDDLESIGLDLKVDDGAPMVLILRRQS